MANEENVKEAPVFQIKKTENEFPFHIKLKDFDGKIVFELNAKQPLQFPYLFWENRLFVTSKDEKNVLLERSYHVFINEMAKKTDDKH